MNWFLKVLGQYADFSGRARRTEFWMFTLFNAIFGAIVGIIGGIIGTELIGSLYGLALLIPTLAVSVRRLHDIGKSGWMILVGLIPLVGVIWLIVLYVQEGQHGSNQYGTDPKEGVY